MKMTRWITMLFITALIVGMLAGFAGANEYTFAVSLGWIENESGVSLRKGFEDAFNEYGGEAVFADASYDPQKQSDQIEAFIRMNPDALFVTPSDTIGISAAVQRAIDAGIPVFSGDSMIAGVNVITTAMSNNFGMGAYTAEFLAKQLDGKGKIAIIDLPTNETWDMRSHGMRWAFMNYPEIEIVATWSFDPTQRVTPRQAMDSILAANPDLDGVWSAWDGGAMESALAVRAAGLGRPIIATGIDGGPQAFEFVQSGTAMVLCMAQSFYEMSHSLVYYAHQHLEGNGAPRLIITPTYAVTQDMLEGLDVSELGNNYDQPGVADGLGWERTL